MENQTNGVTKIVVIFFLLVLFFIGGFYLGRINNNSGALSPESGDYQLSGDIKKTRNNVDVNLLWEVWSILESDYINKTLDGQQLLYGAVKGLVSGLDDPYTAFLTPNETEDYQSSNRGEFEGIGTTLRQEGEFVVVESPIDGAPAQKAGLKPGDLILEVEGKDMQGISVFEVASNIRGEAGSNVKIALFRPAKSERYEVEITREKIDIDNIAFETLDNGLAKVKIFKFTEESVQAFNNQWDGIVAKIKKNNPKGLVIDLRNNPGGYVNSVEYVLSDFLKRGTLIFSEEDRDGGQVKHNVTRDGRLLNIPVVIMVNEGSASASEIFAGAMQDHDRAKVVGTTTVGKGVEQRLLTLSDGSTLQLVFQKWLLPSGRNINSEDSIHPDITVEEYEKQEQKAIEQL